MSETKANAQSTTYLRAIVLDLVKKEEATVQDVCSASSK
jgi:hypothetical protein